VGFPCGAYRRGIVSNSKNGLSVTHLIWIFSAILVGGILLYSRQQQARAAQKTSSVNAQAVAPVAPRVQRRATSPHDLTGPNPPVAPRELVDRGIGPDNGPEE
jgi:hypothetical protein